MSKGDVLIRKKMQNLYLQSCISGHRMSKEGLENLTLIGYDGVKRSREKEQVTY